MAALYQNAQWRVTSKGMESLDPSHPYSIRLRLLDNVERPRPLGKVYDPPIHLAQKSWVDIDAFLDAYDHALDMLAGQLKHPVDEALLAKTFGIARKVAGQSRVTGTLPRQRRRRTLQVQDRA